MYARIADDIQMLLLFRFGWIKIWEGKTNKFLIYKYSYILIFLPITVFVVLSYPYFQWGTVFHSLKRIRLIFFKAMINGSIASKYWLNAREQPHSHIQIRIENGQQKQSRQQASLSIMEYKMRQSLRTESFGR